MAGSLRQSYNFVSPVLAVHADWSVSPAKRWMSVARREAGRWRIEAPEKVGEAATLAARLLERAAGAAVALGVDFPIGLPRAYARAAGIDDFVAWFERLDPAAPLFHPCANLAEISLGRPFYPLKTVAGAGQMARLAAALGMDGAASLRRAVDCRTARRPAGAPLFWTMGANQCGKAAISGWRDCLLPALAQGLTLRLWPFAGAFHDLLAPDRIAIAETYPAEAMVQTGLRLAGSKRRQSDRSRLAPALHAHFTACRHDSAPELIARIGDGFGAAPEGEDAFDSLLGVLGLIRVIDGAPDGTEAGLPGDSAIIRAVEGWVLGQVDPPLPPAPA
ncbi:MAG: hypothetical protein B7Z76_04880 [Acidiphilium sp. 20-67-58]|nr:MAG: hypothetical protein B7Z76_04880 [Acidiphilium sp. 20-67-58]